MPPGGVRLLLPPPPPPPLPLPPLPRLTLVEAAPDAMVPPEPFERSAVTLIVSDPVAVPVPIGMEQVELGQSFPTDPPPDEPPALTR